MVCPCVLVADESIAQVAVPGTRPVRSLYAPQKYFVHSQENPQDFLIAVQNSNC